MSIAQLNGFISMSTTTIKSTRDVDARDEEDLPDRGLCLGAAAPTVSQRFDEPFRARREDGDAGHERDRAADQPDDHPVVPKSISGR